MPTIKLRHIVSLARFLWLRVFVDVPQARMRDAGANLTGQIRVSEFPDRTFNGKVVRTAGALAHATRVDGG